MKLIHGDCRQELKSLPDNSVDLVVTDPPYFIDGMGDDWADDKLQTKASKAGVIGGLPVGMKFDPQQGVKLHDFLKPICAELYRVLKPGGFCLMFSQARLYHRTAMPLEEAGFEIRDMMGWGYEGQAKAFSQLHFIKKRKDLSEDEKERLCAELVSWKTPQLKPRIEPVVMAQKPKEGTFVDNWIKWGVGLVNTTETLDGKFPANVVQMPKSARNCDTDFKIEHLTVKPVALISHFVRLFTKEGAVVLDPFMGSGSHGVAAVKNGRDFIGIEREAKYFEICEKRLKNCLQD